MITAGDFKKGITIEWDGGVWNIVDFQHVKPGKGAAFVRTKIKNVMTGAVVERSFNPTDKMPKAIIETKEMQYVYNDGDLYYFMDVETYEQLPLSKDQVEDAIPFVKEGTNVTVRFFKGSAFSVEAPNFVVLEVTDTEPGFAGDTASNPYKPATLETGWDSPRPRLRSTSRWRAAPTPTRSMSRESLRRTRAEKSSSWTATSSPRSWTRATMRRAPSSPTHAQPP